MAQPEELLPDHPAPPPDFDTRALPVINSPGPWYRLNSIHHKSALYFDCSGRGRFDGPKQGYGMLYVGEDEYACFIECYGRVHGARGVSESALRQRNLVQIQSDLPLALVDITGSGLVKLGADARISSGPYLKARQWAKAIHEHPQKLDGIRYRSRHDANRICCGLFDRVFTHLSERNLGNLIDNPSLLGQIVDHYGYGLLGTEV